MHSIAKEISLKLRNRSYMESFTENGQSIKSLGAWRMTLSNEGNVNAYIIDGAGNRKLIQAGLSIITLVLDGAPYITRDDEFTVEFEGAGLNPLLVVIFDRLVPKKEDNDYPLDQLLKDLKE
jgi:hypothetical protein